MGPSRHASPTRGGGMSPCSDWEEEGIDDMTIGLYVQQFMDEWHYRALNSGLALDTDRVETIVKALDLFEAHGVPLGPEEKIVLASMEEEDMIQGLVAKMESPIRKTIEHFLLQLQLVLSTATRVRSVLDEGAPEDIARIMEDGDTGISQQILKEIIVEAGREASELLDVHASWSKSMDIRANRLIECSANAGNMEEELKRVEMQLARFRPNQNPKAMKAILGLCGTQDGSFRRLVLASWLSVTMQSRNEKGIREKYEAELQAAKEELVEYKLAQKGAVFRLLTKQGMASDEDLIIETLNLWLKTAQKEKFEREGAQALQAATQRLNSLKESQKVSAKSSLMRLAMGSDTGLKTISFQAWAAYVKTASEERDADYEIKAAQRHLQEVKRAAVETATGVLFRLATDNDGILLTMVVNAWVAEVQRGKKRAEAEVRLSAEREALQEACKRQRDVAMSQMIRLNQIDDENLLMNVVMNWAGEARLGRVIRHYTGKMDTKKQQLEAVQQMFKSFAAQLEQGIGSTPRSQRRSTRPPNPEGAAQAAARPPQLPAA